MNNKELSRHLIVGIYGDEISRSEIRYYPNIETAVIRANNELDALKLIEEARRRGYIETEAPASVILATCCLNKDDRTDEEVLLDLFKVAVEATPENLKAATECLVDLLEA